MSESMKPIPKQHLLENPTNQPLDRFAIMLDREASELSLCKVTIPPQSTVNLADQFPSVASGRESLAALGHPGITEEEAQKGFALLPDAVGGGESVTSTTTDVPGVYLARDGAIIENTTSQQITVTVVVEDRQPRPDGQQYIRDEDLVLPPRSELTLLKSDRCLYVLPGYAEPEDIQRVLSREWEVVGEVTKDGTVKKKRERKKDARKAQKEAKSG